MLGNLVISVQDTDASEDKVATGVIGIGNGRSGNSGATKNRHIAPQGVPIYYGVDPEAIFHAVMISMRHAVMVSMT